MWRCCAQRVYGSVQLRILLISFCGPHEPSGAGEQDEQCGVVQRATYEYPHK